MDARRMCLASESVDVIICDVPFGSNEQYLPPAPLPSSANTSSSTSSRLGELYWSIFAEFYRVIRKANGRAVILTDQVRDIPYKGEGECNGSSSGRAHVSILRGEYSLVTAEEELPHVGVKAGTSLSYEAKRTTKERRERPYEERKEGKEREEGKEGEERKEREERERLQETTCT